MTRFTSLTNLVTLPGYTTPDAAQQYTLGQRDVDVSIKNLAHRKLLRVGPTAATTT